MLIDENKIKSDIQAEEKRFRERISLIRTGRPTPSIFENIFVNYYGNSTQLAHLGQISFSGMSVTIKVFDQNAISLVDEALKTSELGASINQSEKGTFNLNFIPMTGEVRQSKVKELNDFLEEARIKVRQNVRRKYMEEVEAMEKVSEDDQKRTKEKIQQYIDEAIDSLEKIAKQKEIEILEV